MADGKWIPGLSAEMPVAEAARLVTSARLSIVEQYLPRVIGRHSNDPENVHQLRVGTRRAVAALDFFADTIPEAIFRKVRRSLRDLRRAAGHARDWDVFRDALATWAKQRGASERPGIDFLLGYCAAQRTAAQMELEKTVGDSPEKIVKRFHHLIDAIHASDPVTDESLVSLALAGLRKLLDEIEAVMASRPLNSDQLHRIRIIGKRLRYAMEIGVDCFPPPFRESVYPSIVQLQETLGDANDCKVAVERLITIRVQVQSATPRDWIRYRRGFEALLLANRRRLPLLRARFRRWLTSWRADADWLRSVVDQSPNRE